jgi:hypothetical protein
MNDLSIAAKVAWTATRHRSFQFHVDAMTYPSRVAPSAPFLILAKRLLRSSLPSDVDQPLAKTFRRIGRYH